MISIVVPCHDEARRIDRAAMSVVMGLVDSVVFVDDGSTDDTARILAELVATEDPQRHCTIRLGTNEGKAEAVRAGLRRAVANGADVVGYLDADLATPPSELPRLCDALTDDVDVVLGSRVRMLGHPIERRAARHYLGRIYATLASAALSLDVYDTQCGAKLFRNTGALRSAVVEPFADPWAFDVELLARLLRPLDAGVPPISPDRMIEVPLGAWRDVDGSGLSFSAGLRATASLIGTARRLRTHPLRPCRAGLPDG